MSDQPQPSVKLQVIRAQLWASVYAKCVGYAPKPEMYQVVIPIDPAAAADRAVQEFDCRFLPQPAPKPFETVSLAEPS